MSLPSPPSPYIAIDAASLDVNLSPSSLYYVVSHPDYGRLLLAKEDIPIHTCIMNEPALIQASYEEDRCSLCNQRQHLTKECLLWDQLSIKIAKEARNECDEILSYMAEEISAIGDVDRARCLFKVAIEIERQHRNKQKLKDTKKDKVTQNHPIQIQAETESDNRSRSQRRNQQRRLKKKQENEAAKDNNEDSVDIISRLLHLTAVKESECLSAIQLLATYLNQQQSCFQHFFNYCSRQQVLSHILAILNTNSHEYTSPYGGSAIYYKACFLHHSCWPNCIYNSNPDSLTLVNISSIKENDILTIDYANLMAYRPTHQRQAILWKSQKFICDCQLCSGILPDKCRQFKCRNSPRCSGYLTIRGRYVHNNSKSQERQRQQESGESFPLLPNSCHPWICCACGYEAKEEEVNQMMEEEQQIKHLIQEFIDEETSHQEETKAVNRKNNDDIKSPSLSSLAALTADSSAASVFRLCQLLCPLDDSGLFPISHSLSFHHYLFFQLYDSLVRILSSDPMSLLSLDMNAVSCRFLSYRICDYLLRCMTIVLPADHEEFLTYEDLLAQSCIACGKIDEAQRTYGRCYDRCRSWWGMQALLTQQYLLLSTQTPQSIPELQRVYQQAQSEPPL